MRKAIRQPLITQRNFGLYDSRENGSRSDLLEIIAKSLKVTYSQRIEYNRRDAILFFATTVILFKNNRDIADYLNKRLDHSWIDNFSVLGDGVVDYSLCIIGRQWGDERTRETADLGLAALISAGVAAQLVKHLLGVPRPADTVGEPRVTGPSWKYDSFPSGHTTNVFALATVIAEKYPNSKWLSYTIASLVGISRITRGAHWPADVFAGAGLGILFGRHVLNNRGQILTNRNAP